MMKGVMVREVMMRGITNDERRKVIWSYATINVREERRGLERRGEEGRGEEGKGGKGRGEEGIVITCRVGRLEGVRVG